MAELLIRVEDKTSPDIYKNVQLTKRGDVIVVCPDGWAWSEAERTAPYWRILRLPEVSVEEANALLSPEPETDPANPSKTLQRRAFSFDLSNVPPAARAFVADDSRAAPALTVNLTVAQFRALKKRKAAVPDPAVIGLDPKVIG